MTHGSLVILRQKLMKELLGKDPSAARFSLYKICDLAATQKVELLEESAMEGLVLVKNLKEHQGSHYSLTRGKWHEKAAFINLREIPQKEEGTSLAEVREEANLLRSLKHENIISFLHFAEVQVNEIPQQITCSFLVLEQSHESLDILLDSPRMKN